MLVHNAGRLARTRSRARAFLMVFLGGSLTCTPGIGYYPVPGLGGTDSYPVPPLNLIGLGTICATFILE